jgi:hypothetical protein
LRFKADTLAGDNAGIVTEAHAAGKGPVGSGKITLAPRRERVRREIARDFLAAPEREANQDARPEVSEDTIMAGFE